MMNKKYEYCIEPNRGWLDVDIKGLWRYRDLYIMYIKRDIVTYYKQTIFGPLWYFVQPILTTIMYMFVFGNLAGISTDGIPQPLFYLSGIALWNYYSQNFGSCNNVFGVNAYVFGKVYFPRLVVPLASSTSNLIRFLIQIFVFAAVYGYYTYTGDFSVCSVFVSFQKILLAMVMIPTIIIMVGGISMSLGLIFSSWTVKYRDLNFVVGFFVQLLMYGTPVIYPLSFTPEKYRWIINLNPLTSLFETFKYVTLGVGTFDISGLLYSFGFFIAAMFLSVIIFNRTEQRFMDTV